MNGMPIQPQSLVIAQAVALSPVLLALLAGSLPLLLPLLIHRWLAERDS